jgi:hypothetical protein
MSLLALVPLFFIPVVLRQRKHWPAALVLLAAATAALTG